MIPWHYSNPERLVESHRASSSRPKNAVKTRKGLLRPENRSRQPRISFWEPAHLVSRLRVATGVPRPCFFRAGDRRSPPLAAMENMRKGPQVLYFEASPGGPTVTFSPGEVVSDAAELDVGAAVRMPVRGAGQAAGMLRQKDSSHAKRPGDGDRGHCRTLQ